VAGRYRPAAYLIGPRLYPVFLGVAQIVLVVLACLYLGITALSLLSSSTRLPELFRPENLWGWIESFVKLAFLNLAVLTLIFALIERFSEKKEEEAAEWDPRQMPAVPVSADPERISPPGVVFRIYAIVALFVWVNFFPETFGIWFFTDKQVHTIPFSDLGLYLPVLLMNVWWALALVLNLWVLRVGRWTRESRWAEFGLGVFGAGILYVILAGGAFTGADAAAAGEALGEQGPLALLKLARANLPVLGKILHFVLTVVLLITLIEAMVRLFRIFRRYPVW
jgi:hypothetical protein